MFHLHIITITLCTIPVRKEGPHKIEPPVCPRSRVITVLAWAVIGSGYAKFTGRMQALNLKLLDSPASEAKFS